MWGFQISVRGSRPNLQYFRIFSRVNCGFLTTTGCSLGFSVRFARISGEFQRFHPIREVFVCPKDYYWYLRTMILNPTCDDFSPICNDFSSPIYEDFRSISAAILPIWSPVRKDFVRISCGFGVRLYEDSHSGSNGFRKYLRQYCGFFMALDSIVRFQVRFGRISG